VRIFGGKAHDERYVRGITFDSSGNRLISVGDDKKILTWYMLSFLNQQHFNSSRNIHNSTKMLQKV